MQRQRSGGFTLIELIVVVTIAAILAAVAIPSYTQYVIRSKRAAAATVLLEAAGALERNFTTNGCYDKTRVDICQTRGAGNDFSLGGLTAAPREGRASYSVAVAHGATGQTFTLTAIPCGMTGSTCVGAFDPLNDPVCGSLTLTQAGAKAITGTGSVANCWQR